MNAKHRLIAIRFPDGLPETEPLCIVQQSTFDQAREALKDMIKVAEVGLRLAGNCEEVITIRLKKSKDILAAMEATL